MKKLLLGLARIISSRLGKKTMGGSLGSLLPSEGSRGDTPVASGGKKEGSASLGGCREKCDFTLRKRGPDSNFEGTQRESDYPGEGQTDCTCKGDLQP